MKLIALIALQLVLAAALLRAQDRPVDEVDVFFAGERSQPTESQFDEIKTLWKKAQVGGRDDRQVARVRLTELGRLAAPFLEEKLRSSSDDEVRNASLVLSRTGDERTLQVLRELIFVDEDLPAGGRYLILALGQLGEKEDVDRLLQLLTKTKRNDERRALCYAIGRLADHEQAEALAAHWKEDKAQGFRAALLIALGRIGGDGALETLREGLRSSKETIRRAAAIAAADARLMVLAPDLIKALKDSDEDVVRHALCGLALIQDESIVAAVRKSNHWRDGENDLRALALLALGGQEGESVDRFLVSRLKPRAEKQDEVLQALAFALGRAPGRLSGEAKERMQANEDPEVARALWCTMVLRSRQSGGLIILALEDARIHDRLRLTLMELLAYNDPDRALEYIEKVLEKREAKKKILERAEELREILTGKQPGGSALLMARIQVEIDDLGGSPEWNLMTEIHDEIRRIEDINRDLGSGTPSRQGQPVRRPDPWTNADEDIRIWFDRHPYFDHRRKLDLVE